MIRVRDGNNCEAEQTFELTDCALDLSIDIIPESGPGANDGELILNVVNGADPVMYSIDGGDTFQDSSRFTGLSDGPYFILIRDAEDCEIERTIFMFTCEFDIEVEFENTSGSDAADGSITITVDGSNPPYMYSIDGGESFQDSPNFENLTAGRYAVVATDGLGCEDRAAVLISDCDILLEIEENPPSMMDATDGSILITASNGASPYRYSIDGGATFRLNGLFTNLSAGDYDIVVRDNNGCIILDSVSLIACDLMIEIETIPSSEGNDDGRIIINASGGIVPYLYSIDGGTNFQSTNTFNNLSPGFYPVLVRDRIDCRVSETVRVVECDVMMEVITEDNSKLSFKGTLPLKLSDFNIEPPSAMFGQIVTGDEITLNFELSFPNN